MAKKIDLKNKSDKDLQKELNDKREGVRAFRFGIAGSKIRNVKEGRDTKKQIAQILTEANTRNK
ncbi:MAG: 50S ribosomal protein L29 [Parcubacteria group bacterium]|nr:50S ribosomal protein L29 [Parcubacteria group bacterium]